MNLKDPKIKTTLILIILVLSIVILIAWYFWHKGKTSTVISPLVADNPNSTSQANNPTGISNTDIKQLSADIYNEISGYNIAGHDATPYQHLLSLSDTDFQRVFNQYNTDYQQQSGLTLAKAVAAEWVLYDPAWSALQTSMNERFAKLNLN